MGARHRDIRLATAGVVGRDFRGADLSRVDFSNGRFDRCVFVGASFRLATIRNASFVRCDLSGADFRGATLRDASFAACSLVDADLRHVDLRGVRLGVASDLTGWRGNDLGGALLDGADLRRLEYRPETAWPVGFDPETAGAREMAT